MYIYQSDSWPHFIWDESKIALRLNQVSRKAGFLSGRLSMLGFDQQCVAAVESLTHDIVCSSEIEGVSLNTAQVRSSVARKLGIEIPVSVEPSHYVDGVVEMMLDATQQYATPLTADRLFGWHCALFPSGRSGSTVIDVGKYRAGEMRVVSGLFGKEKVHYVAPKSGAVESEMSRFLSWFNSQEPAVDYLKSAIAHLWFVCIHPFDDGNGRIGRAIADMALSQADNSKMRFFSMSRQISIDKKSYYSILERTQCSGCDITAWLDWYLDCMLRAIENASCMLSQVLNKSLFWAKHERCDISARQRDILNFYLDGYQGKLTAKNWAKQAHVSADTALRDIKDLVGKSILEPQQGRVRDVFYGIRCNEDTLLIPGPKDED